MNSKKKNLISFFVSLVLMLSMLAGTSVNCFAAATGDIDGDGKVTEVDVQLALLYARNSEFTADSRYNFTNADMDGDKMITATDAAAIKNVAEPYVMPEASTLYVFGDSTACNYGPTDDKTHYYKRVGFGTRLSDYFVDSLTVKNYALSGRSSKSFITDETGSQYYADYIANVKKGDFVIIAFGHNDEKSDDSTRYTSPSGVRNADGTYTEGSFKNSNYVNYIKPALDKGAIPIIATPIVRRTTSDSWSDSCLHKANGGDYRQDGIDLASDLGLTCIDNTLLTKDLYTQLTPSETVYLHAWSSSKESSVDNTHLNNFGAAYVSYMMANELLKTENPLKKYVKPVIVPPTKASLVINPDYKEKVQGELTRSEFWTTVTEPWWGTVFGDMGGMGKVYSENPDTGVKTISINPATNEPYYVVEQVGSDGALAFNLRSGAANDENKAVTSVGKISSTNDGMASIFRIVDSGTNFVISANAHINGIDNTNNQVSFGAVVHDTVDIDYHEAAGHNYVAAGILYMGNATKTDATTGEPLAITAGFGRIDNKIVSGAKVTENKDTFLPKKGDVVPVKITKLGNKYTVEYNGVVSEITADFTDDVYVGFFTSRCADVTFTDVVYNNEVVEP